MNNDETTSLCFMVVVFYSLPFPRIESLATEIYLTDLSEKKTDLHVVEMTDTVGQCPCGVRSSAGHPSLLCPPSDEWSASSTDWHCRKIRRPILEIRSPSWNLKLKS